MRRREFIKKSALSVPVTLGGFSLVAGTQEWDWLKEVDPNNDNILVLLQLNGGNDGLNTFIPINQYANLFNARKNILIPENQLLTLDKVDDMKFHPSMSHLKTLFDTEKMGIIQNVGYPNPNKSHFRSTDIWTSGSDADVIDNTGWLGRYLNDIHPQFPTDYPNTEFPAPLALTVDSLVSNTCQGTNVNMSFAINNLNSITELEASNGGITFPDNAYGNELQFIIQSIAQSNAYGSVINQAADKGNNLSQKYDNTSLSKQLKIVANLISGGLGTKIYIVKLGGFDTHDSQVDPNNVLIGRHADLLSNMSLSIGAFMEDLQLLGQSKRVVMMSFSEFGRRTKANGSDGTDHGEAAPVMLFGEQVTPIIHGENPVIPDQVDNDHNIPMLIDFRSVYGSILMDLFGISETAARTIVHPDFTYMQLLNGSAPETVLGSRNSKMVTLDQNFPNPVKDYTTIRFSTRGLPVYLSLMDMSGTTVKVVVNKRLDRGNHEIQVDLSDLPTGQYFYRLKEGMLSTTKKLLKE